MKLSKEVYPYNLSISSFLEDVTSGPAVAPKKPDFPVIGRRILDVFFVAERLALGCYDCKAELRLIDTVQEDRRGLASIFHVKCSSGSHDFGFV